MPFYFRKSVSAGPFRFNFSKGGVGVSVGVKGFRVGTGPRGHYVHAGRGGVYYRASLGSTGERRIADQLGVARDRQPVLNFDESSVKMVEIESGDLEGMRDEAFGELLDEINAKQRQLSMAKMLGWGTSAIGLCAFFAAGTMGLAGLLLVLPAWGFGRWLDSYRRTTVLFYDLEDGIEQVYQGVTVAFDAMSACAGKWHIEAGGAVQDLTTWKRNAGASRLIRKKATTLSYMLPKVIKSNLTPPALHVGRQVIYFLPDVALIEDGRRIGAVGYEHLEVAREDSIFIEQGTVPRDAQVIGHTWKYPNKSGGPDRRFRNNYQIPLCRYEAMHLMSASGVNELMEFSRVGVVEPFARALKSLPNQVANAAEAARDPLLSNLSNRLANLEAHPPHPGPKGP